MHLPEASVESGPWAGPMRRATVIEVDGDGTVWCACDDEDAEILACDVLIGPAGPPPTFLAGDAVLVCLPGPRPREGRGVVLGKVGRARPVAPQTAGPPDELVIEARRELVFRCGDGSITLRADGKVLIKGKDLVSHARRMIRIKGGSVAIN